LLCLGETTANLTEGKVKFTYTSATDVVREVSLFSLTFYTTSEVLVLDLSVTDIYDWNFEIVPHTVVGETIKTR
jgi:hypothetical protein